MLLPDNLPVNIRIEGTKIISVSPDQLNGKPGLTFENAMVFPGLINSHDHLDFNLFPPLGNKIYNNYMEWGREIHILFNKEINDVLRIPEELRTSWGIYKNLLCGVTTVVNHGKDLPLKNPLINIIQQPQSLHSVAFERNWRIKLNNLIKKNVPCIMHAGEGTDENSREEIDRLIKWNLIKRDLIAVHGVAMNENQASKFNALVWCPASNYFLLNRTAAIENLKRHTSILLGTDSTLTSSWNIWEHIRMAANSRKVNGTELFEMLNKTPAATWRSNTGIIAEGKTADIVIARSGAAISFPDNFYGINPEDILMVICNGCIRLFDEELLSGIDSQGYDLKRFSKIKINRFYKYVEGNLAALFSMIKNYHPGAEFPIIAAEMPKHLMLN